ncbi:hypothetical protein ARMGADRAFT_1090477 [Armillaria gallica]|uniref:Uncharacterized protein n=1 Tax=Armillaria gallica TaxID=47427 RepID=A0A2H3CZS6_ARMGA|nr:hypothetical protein ARMGADRAFT_1090477 [Armillaria gallica]
MITLIMGRDIHWANEEENSGDENLTTQFPIMSFEHQQALIAKQLGKSPGAVTEKQLNEDIPLPKKKARSAKSETIQEGVPSANNARVPGVNEKPIARPQTTPDESHLMVNVDELQNHVVLQRIHLSQMHDGMELTVADQGIIFDHNNNAWLRPDHQEKVDDQPKEGSTPQGPENDLNDNNRDVHRTKERNPDGPPDDGDDSNNETDKSPHHNPFIPRMGSRGVSLTPSRSIKAKVCYAEHKCQQIIEFVHCNLGTKLIIPDGLKGAHLDVKSMKKYDGTPSRDRYWEWLWSMVFAYRASQMGGPDRDEE